MTPSRLTVYPPRHLDLTGQGFGCITILKRGPNARDGSARWWVKNALNVHPEIEYLLPRRSLWRKRAGNAARRGCGLQTKYPALYRSVVNHFKWIENPIGRYHGYAGMPAYDAWNPKNGPTAVVAAVRGILAEIGDKPDADYNLHIVDPRIGFWPGNLKWVPASHHKRIELLNLLIEENARLKEEIAALREASHV